MDVETIAKNGKRKEDIEKRTSKWLTKQTNDDQIESMETHNDNAENEFKILEEKDKKKENTHTRITHTHSMAKYKSCCMSVAIAAPFYESISRSSF